MEIEETERVVYINVSTAAQLMSFRDANVSLTLEADLCLSINAASPAVWIEALLLPTALVL